jgi:hypothetical protein
VHVLEDRQPGHQPCRQRRPAGDIGVGRAEALLEEVPVDSAGEPRQRVIGIDDLIKTRAQQIVLAAVAPFLRSHRRRSGLFPRSESRLAAPDQFARKCRGRPDFPANPITCDRWKDPSFQLVGSSSRATS